MDGSQAVSELKEVRAAKDSLKKATKDVNTAEAKATTATRKMGAASASAAAKAKALAVAEKSVAREAITMGNSHRAAAGQVSNLTAQFNDIGVMMAAGQNPLQLALQQGTQISQVIGPMGAAGAVKSLGKAFVAMISPISIITIGSIAAASAMVNWLTSAGDEALTLEDAFEAVGSSIDAFAEKAKTSRLSTAEMVAEFGSASPELRAVLVDMTALAKMDAYKSIDQTAASLRDLVDLAFYDDRSSASAAQDFLGLYSIRKDARAAGAEFARNLGILEDSKDPALKLRVALDVREMLLEATGGLEGLNAAQQKFYEGLATIIRDMELLNGKVIDHEEQQARAQRAKTVAAYAYYAQTRAASDEQLSLGQDILVQLQSEMALQQAIAVHGEGSIAVAEQRLASERAIYKQQTEARDIANSLKAELMAAWDAANKVAAVDMAGNITLAADEAHRLTQNLVKARGQEIMSRVRQNPDFNDPRGESPGAGDPDYVYQGQNLPGVDMPSNPQKKRNSGAKQIEAERRAIERLIERERERLEVLRETDPVLKEMIRVRDILKNATDAEREAVEAMIRERLKEQGIIEQTSLATDFLETNVETLAEGLVAGGERAADAWKQVEAAILAAALQALLLGEGPWADMFGMGGDTGGVTGIILDGLGLADGGTVYGAGGNKDDKVPAWLSPGETVVTAKATRQYRPLLQAMNDGVEIPGLAGGGTLAPQAATQSYSATSATGQPPVLLRILPSPLFKVMVDENATNIVLEVVEDYDRNVAPDTIKRTINDPRRAGG